MTLFKEEAKVDIHPAFPGVLCIKYTNPDSKVKSRVKSTENLDLFLPQLFIRVKTYLFQFDTQQ